MKRDPYSQALKQLSEATSVQKERLLEDDGVKRGRGALVGHVMTPSTRKKISDSMTGRKRGPPTDETKAKISAALMGKKYAPRQNKNVGKT